MTKVTIIVVGILATLFATWMLVFYLTTTEWTVNRFRELVPTLYMHLNWNSTKQSFTTPQGDLIRLDPSDKVVCGMMRGGHEWEYFMQQYIMRYASKDAISLDVGANIGVHAITMAKYSKRVIAFEPQPHVAQILRENVGHFGNVEVREVALGDTENDVYLEPAGDNVGNVAVSATRTARKATQITLDSLDFGPDVIGLMKIDIEGYEPQMLKGAMETIRKHKPVILLEDFVRSRSALEAIGYKSRRISRHDYLLVWRPSKP